MYIEANQKLYQPTRVGTFLHYMFINIMKSKQTELIEEAFSYLRRLMTLKENNLDLLMVTILFGINQYQNIKTPLLKKYEMPNESIQSCFNHMTAHMNETKSVVNDDLINGKTQTVYSTRSPCIDIETYPVCEHYCQWHSKVRKTLTREEIQTLLG